MITAGAIGAFVGAVVGIITGTFSAFLGLASGFAFIGSIVGAGIGWLVKAIDGQQRSVFETYAIVAGYVCAATALVLLPPLFGIAGALIGWRNLKVPSNLTFGRIHIVLSIICGLFGICLWGFLLQ